MIDPESLEDHILFALRRMSRAIDLRSRVLLQKFGLTAPQLATLRVVERLEPVSASGIAQSLHLGQPTMTGILHRLESRGYVRRQRGDRDRRSVSISLTDASRSLLRQAPSLLPPRFQRQLAALEPWERAQIFATFGHVAEMLGSPAEDDKAEEISDALIPPEASPAEDAPLDGESHSAERDSADSPATDSPATL